jgi:uncharacterized membrane protein YsdA (DUF1294 family)
MLIYIAIIVSLLCFVLYVLDRRMRGEPIDWITALKVSVVGALLSGGTGYAMGEPEVAEVIKVAEVVSKTDSQEMFVGVPTF